MQIGILQTADLRYGGSRYESMTAKALSGEHNVTIYDATPWMVRGHRPQSFVRTWIIERGANADIWIRNEIALCCMTATRQRKHIGIIHHLDESIGPLGIWNRAMHKRLLANTCRCERVVVVSQYWQDRLADLGVHHTVLIHNAFDVQRFTVRDDEVQAFKTKHGLGTKPLVYIGNCQKHKGAKTVWHALKGEGYQLVSSGVSDIDIPIQHFQLAYDEYILLLASCDVVVTMSQFDEGWNRTAHEAILCKTPVIGSGTGGMGELLRGAGQLLCQKSTELPGVVQYALAHRQELGTQGFAFASGFTVERFSQQWLRLISAL